MAHGGARPGAGRKPGTASQKTRDIANKAAVEGITPLEVMLRAMREFVAEADRLDEIARNADTECELLGADVMSADTRDALRRSRLGAITQAATLAKDAAPYIHPRLANINATVDGDMRATVKIVSEFPDE